MTIIQTKKWCKIIWKLHNKITLQAIKDYIKLTLDQFEFSQFNNTQRTYPT